MFERISNVYHFFYVYLSKHILEAICDIVHNTACLILQSGTHPLELYMLTGTRVPESCNEYFRLMWERDKWSALEGCP